MTALVPNCHKGKSYPSQMVREMMRAVGIETCPYCFRVYRMHTKKGVYERQKENK